MANAVDDSGSRCTTAAATTNAPGGAAVRTEAATKPFYRRIVEKFAPSPPAKDKAADVLRGNITAMVPSIVPATNLGQPAAELGPAEIARIQRDAIDASYFAELERKAVKAIKDPKRKLICRLSICQNDEEWITQREKFRELIASTSISAVLETEFEPAQKSLFIPSLVDGPLLEVQLQNAKQYKDHFKQGARFHGTPDNMLTKLTMLKFGLPIEALTEMNLNRCDNRVDEDDPPDNPGPNPPFERILYSQRPLEFLDMYNERSFGYPIMRRPKLDYLPQPTISPENIATGGIGSTSTLTTAQASISARSITHNGHHNIQPIFPTSRTVSMRGGAGSSQELNLDPPRYLYGKKDDKVKLDIDSCEAFKRALFTLFPDEGFVGNTKSWFFHIDVYCNNAPNSADKPWQRTVDIDPKNIEDRWVQTIRHLIFNYEHDWLLRIQTARGMNEPAPKTFALSIAEGSGQKQKLEPPPSSGSNNNDGREKKNSGSFRPNSRSPSREEWNKTKNRGSGAPANTNNLGNNDLKKAVTSATNSTPVFQTTINIGPEKSPRAGNAKGIIYGYHGKLEAVNTAESFLRVALLLTGQCPENATEPNWTFDVDIPVTNSVQRQTITMIPRNWARLFSKAILPFLVVDQPWQVFVRNGGSVPTGLEPSGSETDIIQLNLEGHGTAYWRIPSNHTALEDYGINQIQPGFVHAMRVLCPEEPRSKEKLLIRSFDMGVDGLECVEHKFWGLVKDDLKNHNTSLKYSINFQPGEASKKGTSHTNVRMVGNNSTSKVARGDWTALSKAILSTSEACLVDMKLPISFRIWQSGPGREREEQSAIIKHSPIEETADGLKEYFGEWPHNHTIWFRPEWEIFELYDVESSDRCTHWDSRTDRSLESFKEALGGLWKESGSFKSFCITEIPSMNGRNIRFMITEDTTEEDWRLYVFDWLHSKHLAIKRNMKVDYVLDKTNPWGLVAPVQKHNIISFKSRPLRTGGAKPALTLNNDTNLPSGEFFSSAIQTTRAVIPKIPEFNKTRILKPTAGRARTQKYATWVANEQELDDLQLQSYTKEQPVVMPGKLPAAPIYGPSRQLQIKVSPNFPTVYVHRLTPSDIDELAEENQMLRNKVLERMWACPICNVSFKGYKVTSIREHVQEHIKQIQEAGDCPICGSASWAFMSMDERREHFEWHMVKKQDAVKQKAWHHFQCPACDRDFSKMRPEAIVEHCLKHDPRIIQYCDKCGLHMAMCTEQELIHHLHICRKAPERKKTDPEPIFCESCGKDTSNQTQAQMILHTRDCQDEAIVSTRTFCKTCGLDISLLNNRQLRGHHTRCTVPRGIERKFCARCATDLSELDITKKSRHTRTCRPNKLLTPPPEIDYPFTVASDNTKGDRFIPKEQPVATAPIQVRSNGTKPMKLDVEVLGGCPISGCHQIIGTMSRQEMFTHFQSHAENSVKALDISKTTFRCPLYDFKGELCNQELSLSDMRFHYGHKGTYQEQLAVQMAGKGLNIQNITTKEPITSKKTTETKKHKIDEEESREAGQVTGGAKKKAKNTSGAAPQKNQKKAA